VTPLVLDRGALSQLAQRTRASAALVQALRDSGHWPPVVPTMVLVESLQQRTGADANVNRLLKACIVDDSVPEALARRAAELRRTARRGSAVDALVAARAEPGGIVLTGDNADLTALAAHAATVTVEPI